MQAPIKRRCEFTRPAATAAAPALASCAALLALAVTPAASAQEQVAVAGAAPTVVLVTGNSGNRKDASAAKMVINRDDIVKFGDSNVTAILRRIPGITIRDSAGQGSEIRMRGLGDGYTQFLVNGEKVPAGFSLDSIAPELIERIEVMRTTTADESAQGIAGALNIILKRSIRRGQRDVKLGTSLYRGRPSASLAGQFADVDGALSYSVAADAKRERDLWPSVIAQASSEGGVSVYRRTILANVEREQTTLNLTPRLSWKLADARSLSIDGLFQHRRFDLQETNERSTQSGTEPVFIADRFTLDNVSSQARVTGLYKAASADGGRLEQKAVLDYNRRMATGPRQFFSDPAMTHLGLERSVDALLKDYGITLTGKHSIDLSGGHMLTAGWHGTLTRRGESRVQRESSPTGYPTDSFDQDFDATIKRVALFVQDEWSPVDRLSLYLGVRWESLRTATSGVALTPVKVVSSVVSPTMQTTWKIPHTASDQLRVSLGRTYKEPTAKDLIPRIWQNAEMTPTTPSFRGNPDLRPELSWGLDAGYEHYGSAGAFAGVSAYARRIDNIILRKLTLEDGMWVVTPTNSGAAFIAGLELELKGKLKDLIGRAPDMDLRFGASANRSHVERSPGPHNRLNQQVPLSATVGMDYRPHGITLTVGANLTFEKGAYTQISAAESSQTENRRSADVYGLWMINKQSKVRVSLAHAAGPDNGLFTRYADGTFEQSQRIEARSMSVVRVLYESAL